jgi:hypothetical protein
MAQDSQNQHQPGTPDCPVVHRTVSGALGWLSGKLAALGNRWATWLKITGLSGGAPDCPVSLQRPRPSPSVTNSSLSGKGESVTAKNHRTVWWHTGLSGESEPHKPMVGSGISGRRVARANGRLGTPDRPVCTGPSYVHRIVSGAPTGPPAQWSDAPDKEGDRAPDCYNTYPVVHRTVRCTTRQKAEFAFQVDL